MHRQQLVLCGCLDADGNLQSPGDASPIWRASRQPGDCLLGYAMLRGRPPVHGLHGSRIYKIWQGMKTRCLDPNNKDYPRYGGRGIDIDPRWINDVAIFATEVGSPPSLNHQIDRIDNNRGYWPGNVKWSTVKENSNNRRSSVFLEHDGRRATMAQWAEEYGIGLTTLHYRLSNGWAVAAALETPARKYRHA